MVSIGTINGYSTREVVYDEDTTLEIVFQDDGAVFTPTRVRAVLANNNVTHTFDSDLSTVTIISGQATITVTPAIIQNTLVLNPWQNFKISWELTLTDGSIKRYKEIVWVAQEEILPSLQSSDITTYYAELSLPNSIPPGQTSWYPQINIAWREVRNWFENQTLDRSIWKAENSQSFRALHLEWTLLNISLYQASRVTNSKIWEMRIDTHTKRLEKLKATTLTYFAEGTTTQWGQAAYKDKKTVKTPEFWSGRSSGYDYGKW